MKRVISMSAVLYAMFIMSLSAYADQLDGHAEFDSTTKILTIPYLDVPLIDPISQQPLPDQYGVFSCLMKYAKNSGGSFSIQDIAYLPNESGNDTHAIYSYDGTLFLPFVDVQTVIVMPWNNVIPGPEETFQVTLKQLMLDSSYFHLHSAVNIDQPPLTETPILSGPATGNEGEVITIDIDNFSDTAQYSTTVDGGVVTHDNGVITWTLPDVDADTTFNLQVTAQEPGLSLSEVAVHKVSIMLQAATPKPILSGDTTGANGADVQIKIENYSDTALYTIIVDGGSYIHNDATITWTLPDVTAGTTLNLNLIAQENGYNPSSPGVYTITVLQLVSTPEGFDPAKTGEYVSTSGWYYNKIGIDETWEGSVAVSKASRSGKLYLETKMTGSGGALSGGISSQYTGFCDSNYDGSIFPNNDSAVNISKVFSNTPLDVVLMFAIDTIEKKFWFGSYGSWHNGNPETGVGGIDGFNNSDELTNLPDKVFFWSAGHKPYDDMVVRAKQEDCDYPAPTGFDYFGNDTLE